MASSVIPRYLQSGADIQVIRGILPSNGSGSITISGTAALLVSTSAVDKVGYGSLTFIAGSTYQNHGFEINALANGSLITVSQSSIADGTAVITVANGGYRAVNVGIIVLNNGAGSSVSYAAN